MATAWEEAAAVAMDGCAALPPLPVIARRPQADAAIQCGAGNEARRPPSQATVNHHAPHWIATACGLAMTG